MYLDRATCIRQHLSVNIICIRIQVARPGHMLPDNMLPWCKRGFIHTIMLVKHTIEDSNTGRPILFSFHAKRFHAVQILLKDRSRAS